MDDTLVKIKFIFYFKKIFIFNQKSLLSATPSIIPYYIFRIYSKNIEIKYRNIKI